MMGLFWDDLRLGQEWVTPSRTITETDVVMFAALTGDYTEVHTSEEVACRTPFGRRIAHGLLVVSIAHGLLTRTGLVDGGTALAFLGIHDWRFQAPVFLGDTVHARIQVQDMRPTRKSGRGIVSLEFAILNQRAEVVQKGTKMLMFLSRPDAGIEPSGGGRTP